MKSRNKHQWIWQRERLPYRRRLAENWVLTRNRKMTLFEYIGKRIKTLRTSFGTRGISQARLADAVGVPHNTVSRWETATYRPSVEDLVNLSRFFGVPIGYFFPDKSVKIEQLPELLAITEHLGPEDIEKLRSYAEFLMAQSLRPKKGRKRSLRDFWKKPVSPGQIEA